jgi:hypothetical protein
MTLEELDAIFDSFRESAFRLETLPRYRNNEEDAELPLFLAGDPLPERSTRTDPWLKRIADTTAAGKRWHRVHVVDRALTDYLRFELWSYEGNVVAGEDVRLAIREDHPELHQLRQDFWLVDAETSTPFLALMRYDDAGWLLGVEQVDDPQVIDRCRRERDLALACSIRLHDYTATLEA